MIHFADIRNLIKAYYHICKLCTCIYIYFLYIFKDIDVGTKVLLKNNRRADRKGDGFC